jgi:DNA-binding FrmR family transcriptional regulator
MKTERQRIRSNSPSIQNSDNADILLRLHSAEGHLRAVCAMLEAGEPCEGVLRQLCAVQAALRAAGLRIIDCQLSSIGETIVHDPCTETRVAELTRLSNLYRLLIQFSGSKRDID